MGVARYAHGLASTIPQRLTLLFHSVHSLESHGAGLGASNSLLGWRLLPAPLPLCYMHQLARSRRWCAPPSVAAPSLHLRFWTEYNWLYRLLQYCSNLPFPLPTICPGGGRCHRRSFSALPIQQRPLPWPQAPLRQRTAPSAVLICRGCHGGGAYWYHPAPRG